MSNSKIVSIENVKEYTMKFRTIDRLWEEDIEAAKSKLNEMNSEEDTTTNEMNQIDVELGKAQETLKKLKSIDDTTVLTTIQELEKTIDKLNKKKTKIQGKPKKKTTKIDDKMIEMEAVQNGKLRKFLEHAILPSKDGGYWVFEDGNVVLKSKEAFMKIEKKIRAKSKLLSVAVLDDCDELYSPDVYTEDFIVDYVKNRINLAKRFNYTFNESKTDEEKGEILISFMKEVITSDIDDEWKCLKHVISCMTQRKQSQIVTFLTGLGGIGKTFFCDILRAILGKAFANTAEATLTGENQFNMQMVGAVCACLEETSGRENYFKLMARIKELATSKELTARKMYVEGFDVTNLLNIFVLSNHFRDIDAGERRIFIPTLNNKYQNNNEHFAYLKSLMTPEALQYVFNYFYKQDTSKYVKVPDNQSKKDAKITNMSYPIKFVVEEYIVKEIKDKRELKMREAYNRFESWAARSGLKTVTKFDLFSKTIRDYLPFATRDGKPYMKDKTNVYDFSTNTLIDRLCTKTKLISMEDIEEMRLEFARKQTESVFEDDEKDCQIIALQNLLKEKEKEIEELKAKLDQPKETKSEQKEVIKEKKPKKIHKELKEAWEYMKDY